MEDNKSKEITQQSDTDSSKDLSISENVAENKPQSVIENDKMRVKCVKCGETHDLKEDDVKILGHIVKRFNQKANPVDYVGVLSVIKGLCTDNDKHIFVFDESFEEYVANTIKEYEDAITKNVGIKVGLDKICLQITETSHTLKELEKKKEYMLAEMAAGGILIDNIKLKFFNLTGSEDMEIWK